MLTQSPRCFHLVNWEKTFHILNLKGMEKYWGAQVLNNNHWTSCCNTNVVQRGCGWCFLRATSDCYEMRLIYYYYYYYMQKQRGNDLPETSHSRNKGNFKTMWTGLEVGLGYTAYQDMLSKQHCKGLCRYRAVYTIYTSNTYKTPSNNFYLRLPAGKERLSKTVVAVGNLPHVPALLSFGGCASSCLLAHAHFLTRTMIRKSTQDIWKVN